MTKIQILRVLGARSRDACILATADGYLVRWDRRGWDCACPDDNCDHVDTIAALIDPRVTGEDQ